jgi:choline dehydrogenase-like flavoprotein
MASSPDVLIIGSGIGGDTLAYRLVQYGLVLQCNRRWSAIRKLVKRSSR